ncbi:hypothetical protein [Caminibacter pacificus]
MRGLEALEYFLENWDSKIRCFDEVQEFEAMVEYALGNDVRVVNTKVIIDRFFDRIIRFENEEFFDLKTSFLPEEIEYDPFSGNLYINRNLYRIKIAPKIC